MLASFIIITVLMLVASACCFVTRKRGGGRKDDPWQICLMVAFVLVLCIGICWPADYYKAKEKLREIEIARMTIESTPVNVVERSGMVNAMIELNVWLGEKKHENRSVWTGDLTVPDEVMTTEFLLYEKKKESIRTYSSYYP